MLKVFLTNPQGLALPSAAMVTAGNGTFFIDVVSMVVRIGSSLLSSILVHIIHPAKYKDITITKHQQNFSMLFLQSTRYLNPWILDTEKYELIHWLILKKKFVEGILKLFSPFKSIPVPILKVNSNQLLICHVKR